MRKKLLLLTTALALAAGAAVSTPKAEANNGCHLGCCPGSTTICCVSCPGRPCDLNCP
jgi:hypothetical protein